MKSILFFLLLLLNAALFAQYTNTIYLDPTNSGDPDQDGTIEHPFDHITDVTLSDNTDYLFNRGTQMDLTATINLQSSGIDAVRFRAYGSGDRPILYMSDQARDIFIIQGNKNIIIDSLHLLNYDTETGATRGIEISPGYGSMPNTENVTISNCEIESGYVGINVQHGDGDYYTENLTISNCEIHHVGLDGIMIRDVTNGLIIGCNIHNVNQLWHTTTHTQAAGGDGIQIGHNCDSLKIYNNIVDRRTTGNKFALLLGNLTNVTEQCYTEIIGNTFYPPKDTIDDNGGVAVMFQDAGGAPNKVLFARNKIIGRKDSLGNSCQSAFRGDADTLYFYYNIIDSCNFNAGSQRITTDCDYTEIYNNVFMGGAISSTNVFAVDAVTAIVKNNLSAGNTGGDPLRLAYVTNLEESNNLEIKSSNTSLYNSYLSITDWETSDFTRTSNLNDGAEVGLEYDLDSIPLGNPPEIGACEYYEGGQSNNAPTINNQAFSIEENTINGAQVGMIIATDPDQGQTLTYSILSGNTDNAFQVNSTTGELTVNNSEALDYETNPEFNLTVQVQDNGFGTLTGQAIITVNLLDLVEPVANFTANTTMVTAGDSIFFQDESLNLPTNWIWQFEGGSPNTSFDENPVITYNTPGIYSVGLVASNSNGYDILIKTDYIEVQTNNNPPIANFTANTTIITAGDSIFFQDESLNLPTNWMWQFEGGSQITYFNENPIVTYNTPGIYNVKLVVFNSNGNDILIKTDYIEVQTNNNPPIANFTANTTIITAGDSIFFQDESLNLPTNWMWQFEGGSQITYFNENPIVTYNTPGIYNVKLVVFNSNGNDILIKTDYIEVQTNNNPPIANFTANTTIITAGDSIFFQDESLNLPTNWMWQFEGGSQITYFNENPIVTYNTPGIYNVKLVVFNSNGNDILIKTDYIEVQTNNNPPIANFTANTTIITAGNSIFFQDESLNLPTNWMWQFEGGSQITYFNENPIVTYNTPGIYNVKLVVFNSNGNDILIKTDYIEVQTNNNPPIANFTANTTIITAGNSIFFQDESLNLPTNWMWQFEGGSQITYFNENPIVTYNTPGIYNVKLVVFNSNGNDILIKTDYIEVQTNNNPPIANFTANTTIITAGDSIFFQDESLNLPTNWMWQFEGGSQITYFNENPIVTYNTPGIYNVKLVVFNSNGNDILIKTDYIEVQTNNNPPIANFTANTTIITAGDSIFFQDESLNLPTNWMWQFEGGSQITYFNENPIVTYNTPGIYNVKLVVFNSNGNDILIKTDYIEVLLEKKGEVVNNYINSYDDVKYMMNLYPNPTNNFININLPNIDNEKYTIKIYSLFGKMAKEIEFNTTPNNLIKKIDVSDLQKGTYIMQLNGGQTAVRKKFVKF